ncbi:type II toxin-antitoxin system PemK/MazF family toxin [Salicola sp. Rm-C-2C1-2]|uniref:type II toxin-antitoxin system PemK/MazF family toxin n=1 Tax=Salicola sp. Rm-C-2C1-2 TaxID=3141321 RepID=UPI0032E45F06
MSGEPGSLVAIPFPYTNLQTAKRRPVVIITPPDRHGDFIALAVTSAPTPENAVAIKTSDLSEGALPKPSWIRYDKVFTLSEGIIVKQYGRLASETYSRVQEGFCHYLGCSG